MSSDIKRPILVIYIKLCQENGFVFCFFTFFFGLIDGNLVEGDTIQLEDGTTAYIQQVTVQQKGWS